MAITMLIAMMNAMRIMMTGTIILTVSDNDNNDNSVKGRDSTGTDRIGRERV